MAEVVAGLLTSAVVKIAGDKLSSAITQQANLCWNFSDDLKDMKRTMESLGALFKDAEKWSVKKESHTMRLWLKRLKYAAYDISDMMDDYLDTAGKGGSTAKVPGMLSCFTGAGKKMVLANKMRNMRDELRKINKEGRTFNLILSTTASEEQQPYDERETTSAVNEERIVGRDGEKKEVIDILSTGHRKDGTMLLPIHHGLGGMGKSTLAQLVYSDTQLQYVCKAWVYVSEVFDLKKIGKSIISQLSADGGHQNFDSLQMISQRLNDLLLGNKKILIVLDDIWEEDDTKLDTLKNILHVNKKGSMVDVLITTRSESIAKKLCTNEAYKLQALADSVCWDIIKMHSRFEDKSNKEKLKEIGLDIAQKCGGVALAAQALGRMLMEEDLDGWSKMNKSDIWNESFHGDDQLPHKKVLPSLKISYEHMASILRLCFSYCAIFPKGHDIYEDDLVHQWIALDFIKEPSDGKKYIKQLLGMSFLQHSKLPITSGENAMRYTMHDLVHDLARFVVSDELIVIDAEKPEINHQPYCRYALIKNYEGQKPLSDILPKKVRALHFSSGSKLGPGDGSFSVLKRLCILDFSACSGINLPSSIGQLKQLKCVIAPELGNLTNLKYLKMPRFKIDDWTHITEALGNLTNLKYLNLHRCGVQCVDFIGNLSNLEHLELHFNINIVSLPECIGNLKKLQILDLRWCTRLKSLPESIGNLRNLHTLNLSYCQCLTSLPDSISDITMLKSVLMEGCSDELVEVICSKFHYSVTLPHFKVRSDVVSACSNLPLLEGTNVDKLVIHSLENVRSVEEARKVKLLDKNKLSALTLSWTSENADRFVEDEDSLGQLVPPIGLESLGLKGYNGKSFPSWFMDISHHLPNLVCITLDSLPKCNNLPPLGQLPNLEKLSLTYCASVVKIGKDFCGGRGAFPRLSTFVLFHMDRLKEWCTSYSVEDGAEEFMFPVLDKLEIESCQKLRLTPCPPICRDFKIQSCDQIIPSLEELGNNIGHLTSSTPTTKLRISFCNCRSLRLFHHFAALQELDISNCNNLTTLPESMRDLMSLKSLDLQSCDSISALPDWLGNLTSLESLAIRRFGHLKSLPESMPDLTSLQSLVLNSCDSLSTLPEWLGDLSSLQRLAIVQLGRLKSLPESMRHLKSLHSLVLRYCNSISALPDWLGDLSSLKNLTIQDCKGIKSLPPCIQQLTNLQKLRIQNSLELKRWCESEENKKKIAHINNIIYEEPTDRSVFFRRR